MSNHGAARYGGKLLLGEVIDSVLGALEVYSETAVELVNAHNRKRGTCEASSQDWAIIIIRSLEDAHLLPQVWPLRVLFHFRTVFTHVGQCVFHFLSAQGTLAKVEKCPKSG